ncbi:hypothetical protein HELRODRAFT_153647, partial [Helobdella robusta]|uniref:Homeobox domain-containing protein n=1 Tax=Helobdella robusta TaxID=6412 RepID=T1ELA6_HELRO
TTQRGGRNISQYQRNILEKEYEKCKCITNDNKERILLATGLELKQIKAWFQNRRTKEKKEQGR